MDIIAACIFSMPAISTPGEPVRATYLFDDLVAAIGAIWREPETMHQNNSAIPLGREGSDVRRALCDGSGWRQTAVCCGVLNWSFTS